MLDLVPSARVAHIGLYRDPKTLVAVEYYFKAPEDLADRLVLVLDPMLATANSAIAAVDRLKEGGAKQIRVVCLLAAPEGIEKFRAHHPEVHIWTAAIDERAQRARLHRARAWATRATGCSGRNRRRPLLLSPLPVKRGEGGERRRREPGEGLSPKRCPSPASLRSAPSPRSAGRGKKGTAGAKIATSAATLRSPAPPNPPRTPPALACRSPLPC